MKKEDSLGGWVGRGRAFQAKGETGSELKMVGSPVETEDSGDPPAWPRWGVSGASREDLVRGKATTWTWP